MITGTLSGSHILPGLIVATLLFVTGCAHPDQQKGLEPSRNHLLRATNPPAQPEEEKAPLNPTDPNEGFGSVEGEFQGGGEVFTVTVTDTPVKDILFALAKDANMNIDIYPGITGRVTLSAINQTMPQILDRIARQVNLHYELRDNTIVVSPGKAYLKIYQVDYINMSRKSNANIKVSSNLSTSEKEEDNPLTGKADKNQSDSVLSNATSNQFWQTLTENINAIIGKGSVAPQSAAPVNAGKGVDMGADPFAPQESAAANHQAAIVAVNPEAGVVSVMASNHQHQLIQQMLDKILNNVHRQVLIESTVVEVELSDRAQEGVDWNQLYDLRKDIGSRTGGNIVTNALSLPQTDRVVGNLPFFNLNLFAQAAGVNPTWAVDATLKLLQRFGNVKVLSSPKIMALNSQPAILKVVENKIFFTLDASSAAVTSSAAGVISTTPLINTKVHSVPVGLVMTVTPQISDQDIVTLNVRPTISNISGWVNDPSPHLPANATNKIPEIRVREMETMLRIHSGQVAVLGGLMQDRINKNESSVPGVGSLPLLGKLFSFTDDEITKTELVVFLRPVVMTQGQAKLPKPVGPRQVNNNIPNATAGSSLDFTQFGQGHVPNPNAGVSNAPTLMAPHVQGSAAPPIPVPPMPAAGQQPPMAPSSQARPMAPEGRMPPQNRVPAQAMAPPQAPSMPPPALDGDTATLRTSTEMDFTRPMGAAEARREAPKKPVRNPTISAYSDGPAMGGGEDVVTLGTSSKP